MCINAEQERRAGPPDTSDRTSLSRASAATTPRPESATRHPRDFLGCRVSGHPVPTPSLRRTLTGTATSTGWVQGPAGRTRDRGASRHRVSEGAVHGTTVPQSRGTGHVGRSAAGGTALGVAGVPGRTVRSARAQTDCDPPGRRGSGGAVGALRGGGPRVGAGAGRRGCRSAGGRVGVLAGAPVSMASEPTVRLERSFSPVARAASATMSATTGAALVRATSLAVATCFCTGPEFHTLPEVRADLLVALPAGTRTQHVAGGQARDERQLPHGWLLSSASDPTRRSAPGCRALTTTSRHTLVLARPSAGLEGSHSGLVRRS